jgi:hypothetical protein
MNKKLFVLLASTAVLATAVMATSCATTAGTEAPVAVQESAVTEIINDGQNPVMNFIGNYYGGRAGINVEAQGTNEAKITVSWSNSYDSKAVWTMSGVFNEEATNVVYNNGIKKLVTFNEKGEVISEETLATDCSGVFVFSYDGVTWDDFNEHIADGMVFKYGSSAEEVLAADLSGETVETKTADTSSAKNAEPTAKPTEAPKPTEKPADKPAEPEEKPAEQPSAEIPEPAHKTAAEISGTYISGRATATVDSSDPDNVMIKVVWSESADTTVIWKISGRYNEETESILYSGCVKKVITYAEDGETELEEVCYTDGDGVIMFSYDGFTWDDYEENVADNMVFIKEA